jgi:hypothetical protein
VKDPPSTFSRMALASSQSVAVHVGHPSGPPTYDRSDDAALLKVRWLNNVDPPRDPWDLDAICPLRAL